MAGTSAQPFVPRELFDQALSRLVQLGFDVIWLKNQMAIGSSQHNIFANDKKGRIIKRRVQRKRKRRLRLRGSMLRQKWEER